VLRYLVRRVLGSIPVLAAASFIMFVLIRATFDPLTKFRHQKDSARVLAEQRKALGLDHPLVVQWWDWLRGFVRGDMGTSSRTKDSVSSMVGRDLWPSLQLLFWATIVAVTVALLLSVYSAVKQYSIGDYVFTGLAYVGIAMPAFWFALIAIGLLVTGPVKWFDLSGPIIYSTGLHADGVKGINLDYFRHLALPVLTLTVTSVAEWSRFGRASMLEVLNADYVRASRAKGVPRRQVVFKHALRNALIPFVTVTVLDTAFLIGGVIITEQIFSISGMGQGFLNALGAGDAPYLLAWFAISATAVILFNLLADVLYVLLDPRIRLT
jgi:peptide/nickel transport system permease protein